MLCHTTVAEAPQKKQSSRKSWLESEKLLVNCKPMKKKKKVSKLNVMPTKPQPMSEQ